MEEMIVVSSFFALAFLAICLAFILLVLQLQAITVSVSSDIDPNQLRSMGLI